MAAAGFLALAGNGAQAAPQTLTTIAEVRALSKEQIAARPPVRLEATIVFSENNLRSFTISDGKDSCFCAIPASTVGLSEPPNTGDRLELLAEVEHSVFMPRLVATKARRLPSLGLPVPRRMNAESIIQPNNAGLWVEVEGQITNAVVTDQTLSLTLRIDGRPIRGQLPLRNVPDYQPPWNLIEARVRIRCVIGTRHNADGQITERFLRIPSMEDIQPLDGPAEIQDLPILNATELLRFESDSDQPVRLRGDVLHWRPGHSFSLRTSKGCLRVLTPQPLGLKPGHAVDVVGYPSPEMFRPSLRATQVEILGQGSPPKPVRINHFKALDVSPQMDLLSVEADLLAATWSGKDWKLQCRMEKQLIEAVVPARDLPEELLTPGIRIALTGICELLFKGHVSSPHRVGGMRLHLRSLDDLRLVRGLPWYKSRNLLAGLGVAVAGAIAALSWALSLRARVAAQTAFIREQINRSVILEERQRIARDWHDTTDQQLAGASILIDSTTDWAQSESVPASIRERLQIARQILDACKRESRATIRDLNSVTLEQEGFAAALHELLDPLARGANMELCIEVEAGPRVLPIHDEHHLLRIASEAVSNAVRHSDATQIWVRLVRQHPLLQLEITDNGKGFDLSAKTGAADHFGLLTMEQRARKIGGKLEIRSAPGEGTTLRIQVSPKPIDP